MEEVIGYIAAAFIGLSLGLIGGGGSILTMPVLVYLFGFQPLLATSYSLFVVGSTSLVGAYNNYRKGLVNFKTVFLFGLSSITTVYLTRKLIIPLIPQQLFSIGSFKVTEPLVTMLLFAILMLFTSISMIRNKKTKVVGTSPKTSTAILFLYGIGIGLVTGFLGAGGGFLLIPTLVLLVGLPMKEAIGTSLLIIALNSLIGFTGDIGHFSINWIFLTKITLIAIAGIFVGGALSKKIPGDKLKRSFGWFVLVMGIYIVIKELLF